MTLFETFQLTVYKFKVIVFFYGLSQALDILFIKLCLANGLPFDINYKMNTIMANDWWYIPGIIYISAYERDLKISNLWISSRKETFPSHRRPVFLPDWHVFFGLYVECKMEENSMRMSRMDSSTAQSCWHRERLRLLVRSDVTFGHKGCPTKRRAEGVEKRR